MTTICPICNKEHERKGASCSHECYKKYLSLRTKGKVGGYREGSGRSISGYFRGIYCGSTYELAWVIYHLDNKIQFKRFSGKISHSGINYIPDFVLEDGTLVEIKGYHTDLVDKKLDVARQNGYTIKILYKGDLKNCFDWVKEKYQVKIETLFDNYKPKFILTCNCCGKTFNSSYKQISCSRSCSLKMNRKISGKNQYTNLLLSSTG